MKARADLARAFTRDPAGLRGASVSRAAVPVGWAVRPGRLRGPAVVGKGGPAVSRTEQSSTLQGGPEGVREDPTRRPLGTQQVDDLDRWWRAANYLSVGQIYLSDNPLLRQPLEAAHVKKRLLGHWGTTPGLNFVYAHLNRAIVERDQAMLFVTGPGHGGPANVANAYLEGTYAEVYTRFGDDEDSLRELFRQFSYPGGIPSHAAPETPGSISEGGELGYSLAHAFGAAFDNEVFVVA